MDKSSIILVAVIGTLGLLIILPEQKQSADTLLESGKAAQAQVAAGVEAIDKELGADALVLKGPREAASLELPPDVETFVAEPWKDGPHRFFPLKVGAKWTYHVKGTKYLVPDPLWSMEIKALPSGKKPGEVSMGWGSRMELSRFWLADGGVRFEALPFVEPLQFLGNRPGKVRGDLVPFPGAVVEGSTWKNIYHREVTHEYTDPRGREKSGPAKAEQTDRAEVKRFENVKVADREIRSALVEWESRVGLKMNGRDLLETLTVEPFRREKFWVAEGIGIVRRQIRYYHERSAEITIQLVGFEYP